MWFMATMWNYPWCEYIKNNVLNILECTCLIFTCVSVFWVRVWVVWFLSECISSFTDDMKMIRMVEQSWWWAYWDDIFESMSQGMIVEVISSFGKHMLLKCIPVGFANYSPNKHTNDFAVRKCRIVLFSMHVSRISVVWVGSFIVG